MTGERFYEAHRGAASDLGITDALSPWKELTAMERARWEQMAFEQDLRDRPVSARLLHGKDW